MENREKALMMAKWLLYKHKNGKNSEYIPDISNMDDGIYAYDAIHEIEKLINVCLVEKV